MTGIFRGLWSGVKSIFSMSLLDIYKNLFFFTGYALGLLLIAYLILLAGVLVDNL